jgi:hypothetical protein
LVKIGFQKNKINRPHSSLRLVDRKRKQLLLRLQLAGLFVIAVIGGLSYLSYDSSRAITNVQVVGIDSINQENISSLVSGELQGAYAFLFAKRNYWLYPKNEIKRQIDIQFTKVKKVNLSIRDKHTLVVSILERVPFALWCNAEKFNVLTALSPNRSFTNCYNIDEDGLAFERLDKDATSSLVVFNKPFQGKALVGQNIFETKKFNDIKNLITILAATGLNSKEILFKDNGDFEIYMDSGEEYIFGGNDDLKVDVINLKLLLDSTDFKNQSATSTKKIEYIDLRFGKKIFFKVK